jgi:hypothetical protein
VETSEQRRTRILTESPETHPTVYDLAVLFGYEPESWDGMWKIPAYEYPIFQLSRNWAVVAEVVYVPGTHVSQRTKRGKQRVRWFLRRAVA